MEFIQKSYVENLSKHPLKSEIEELRSIISSLYDLEEDTLATEMEGIIEQGTSMLYTVNLRLQNQMPPLYDKSKQVMYFEIMELNKVDFSYRLKYSLDLELILQKLRKNLKETFEKALKYVNDEAGEIIKMKITKEKNKDEESSDISASNANGKDDESGDKKKDDSSAQASGSTIDDLHFQIYMKNMVRNRLRAYYGLTSAKVMDTGEGDSDAAWSAVPDSVEVTDDRKLKIEFVKKLITEAIDHCSKDCNSQLQLLRREVIFKLNFLRKAFETNKDPFHEILVNWELEAGHRRHNYGM